MPRLFALLAALAVSALIVSSAWSAIGTDPIRFTLELEGAGGRVEAHFTRGHDQHWSSGFAAGDLVGLDVAAVRASGSTPLRFALVREAGRLDCDGKGGEYRARGSCHFAADAGFAAFLADRGIGRPDEEEAFTLMAVDARRELVDALHAARYPRPDVDQIIALTAVGVGNSYIADLARAGYRPDTLGALLQFKALDISPEYIQGFVRIGYGDLRPSELVQLRALGIDHEFIAQFERIGYRRLPVSELVQLKALGITPDFVSGFERIGYRHLSVSKLVQLKATGITPDDVRAVRREDGELPSPHELVRRRSLGS